MKVFGASVRFLREIISKWLDLDMIEISLRGGELRVPWLLTQGKLRVVLPMLSSVNPVL